MNISYSRVQSYLSCPYKHFLSYVEGLSLKKPVRPLRFGSDFHKLLEVRTDPEKLKKTIEEIGETYYDMPASWQSELGDDYVESLSTIFQDYTEIYANCSKPKVTELEFEIPMGECNGEKLYFKGFIDELYKYKDKSTGEKYLKIGEHKTFSRKPDTMLLVMNTQKSLYAKACQFLYGLLPRSVIWDYIHSQPADEPIWMEKTKRFSTAKSQKITPMSYRRACEKRGITDSDALSQANDYTGNIQNFFFRVEQDVIPDMVDNIWDGFSYTAMDIAKNGSKNKTKNITMNCSFCAYKDLCYTELTGGNVESLIEKEFERK